MNINERFIVTISRELGAGGRTVGRELAARLGVKFYDKSILEGLVKEFNLTEEQIEELKGRKQGWWSEFCDKLSRGGSPDFSDYEVTPDDLFKAESLGSSRPIPELFATANIKFDFTPKTLEPLMQVVWDELSKL